MKVLDQYYNVKAVLIEKVIFSGVTPESFVVMNATRPLVGQNIAECEEANARFFSVIDLDCEYAQQMIEANIKLDASIVVFADKELQQLMAVIGTPYFDKYIAMDAERQKKATAVLVHKLNGRTYQELTQKKADALATQQPN